ncbi:uncharacterized protein SPSK_01879 [Sporothrix schenckii 1099-18]|uniref:Methyltransferase n=2 Tax=Sporothrix schenckii TaxID=29908 RepID=U7PJJ7_SPOS1|nr:uncharacterized protein SPSK_01879 [Sporothrix schenckii 1099-18]ERS95096.1 hypothetical protein HMPREF1624_08586 [Sporothrix schenckii ATCC 58251]KJR87289.1 hypothetical protein SPSK_01879 [Sporothrix schenckii 1099-18]
MARDVETTLNYYDDPRDGSEPTPVYVGKGTVTNERPMTVAPVTAHDITGREGDFTLNNCGFQLLTKPTAAARECIADNFQSLDLIQRVYFPDTEDILRAATGAARVVIFDHKIRRGPADWHARGPGNASQRGPLHRVHVDQSYDGAAFLLRWTLPDEADHLAQRRWQIINAWRPFHTVTKDPLAVADARSIPDADLVQASVFYPDHTQHTWTVTASRDHRWYYKHRQSPDEVMLIKCFDSVDDGSVARRVPHSAFRDKAYDEDPPRESIEVRTLVFYED